MLSGSSINSYDCYIFSVLPRSLFPTLLAIERTSTLQHKQWTKCGEQDEFLLQVYSPQDTV